jgi:hypothetical protein
MKTQNEWENTVGIQPEYFVVESLKWAMLVIYRFKVK